ncbi:hypothetical protein P3X46_024376 [Hevea brasiliensis]|uniref:Uncharacterized protein n=1 Tax=Hevea brasiliensis TaxID=3981 RepID=A0ABQ9L298_HEVBR|nr:hypothetical protein P3X46_024376 [Hevea brasiliensis]
METRLLMFASQAGNLELNMLKLRSTTASEVKLTEIGDEMDPDKRQEYKCNSVKWGSLFNCPTQFDSITDKLTPLIAKYFRETRPVTQSRFSALKTCKS